MPIATDSIFKTYHYPLLDEKGAKTGKTVTLQGHLEGFGSSGQRVIAWTVLPTKGGQLAERGVSPSCRTAGLGLVRADADYAMFDVDKRMGELFKEDAPELGKPILVASDLILGYVPEIWAPPVENPNGQPRWYSLTKREVLFPELGIKKYVSDGHLSIGVGEAQDAAPRDQVDPERQGYVSPGLFTYTNAPLGAPLEGRSFTLPEDVPGGSAGPDPLRVRLTPVPGSLPLVRYSSISTKPFSYHVRCRAVDVAGNSRKLDPKVLGSPELRLDTFVERQESVAPPRVLTDGRLNLIRNPGAKLKTLVVTDTVNCDTRMLIPPKCTSDMALRFGRLVDGRIQNGHWNYIQLDKYAEVPEEECIQPPTAPGEKKKYTPTFRYARVNQTQPGFYYFPDPDCKFASLALHPFYSPANHLEPIRVRIPFYGGRHWPCPIPIRINLYPLAADEVEPRVVVGYASADVYLPWGWTAFAEISSCSADTEEDAEQCRRHFATLSGGGESVLTTLFGVQPIAYSGASSREQGGVLELLASSTFVEAASSAVKTLALAKPLKLENGDPMKVGSLEVDPLEMLQGVTKFLQAIPKEKRTLRYLVSGAVREITPPELLHFVCATRTPLVAPSLAINDISEVGTHGRKKDATVAHLTVSSVADEKSTSELTIMASWRRLQDDPTLGDPVCVWDRTELPARKLSEPRTLEPTQSNWRQDLDLRSPGYRRVRYRLTALSRFSEYFAGTKKAALSCKGCNDVQIDHLNVTRPKEPPLRYLVPTHTWTSSVHPLINKPKWEFRSSRRNGIRVYLGRGWELEELLGVVVHPRLSQHDAEELNAGRYPLLTPETSVAPSLMDSITQWGADPIVRSGLPRDLPTASDFEGFRYVAADVSLPLADGSQVAGCDRNVAVVGYKPKWHAEKKLWYCDIGLRRIPSYGCFLRMIFARFQPKSIKGMELSAPVVADFIQVLPERTVSVTRDPFDKQGRSLRVVVYEPAHEAKTVLDPEAAVSNRFEVHLEQPCAFPAGSEFGWIEDTDIQPILEPTDDKNVLYCGKIVIPAHTGRRRLVVREFETWRYTVGDEKQLRERECFCNTLEL